MGENHTLHCDAMVSHGNDQLSCDLNGEIVLLSIQEGKYYALDEIGSHIWSLLATPLSISALRDLLVHEFDVESERCEHEILLFLEELLKSDLIQIVS